MEGWGPLCITVYVAYHLLALLLSLVVYLEYIEARTFHNWTYSTGLHSRTEFTELLQKMFSTLFL